MDHLSQVPNGPLYHYTDQAGLLGIIENREIWATHTQYLNDLREFLHAMDLVRQELQRLTTSEHSAPAKHALVDMMESVSGLESINVCIASFSANRDSLSMFRAYGSGGGFAIGIPVEHFQGLAPRPDSTLDAQKFVLGRCIYDPDHQRQIVGALVAESLREIVTGYGQAAEFRGGYLAAELNQVAPLLKDRAFEEEQEWRLISRPRASTNKQFGFRRGRSTIIPYCRLPLQSEDAPFRLSEVVIGPTPNETLAVSAVENFLTSKRNLHVPVHMSQIPFRSW